MPTTQTIQLRNADAADAHAIARLSGQLGYPITPETAQERLLESLADPQRAVVIAHEGSSVIGWLEVRIASAIEGGSLAEIVGLIVDDCCRTQGIGGKFVEWAKAWALTHGQTRLRVRTNIKRTDAAAFYPRQGFQEIKQQRVFEIALDGRDQSTTS